MVKNKTTCKTKKTAARKGLAPLDDAADFDIQDLSPELYTTGRRHLGFPDQVYMLAAAIFQNNHLEKPASQRLLSFGKERGLPLPQVKDKRMQRTAYELAFSALKYQELLEDIMIDSCFHLTKPTTDDRMSLLAVLLYDFQDRDFVPWACQAEDEIIQDVRELAKYLLKFKTLLEASLARYRVKHKLASIEHILPESVKTKQERSSNLPLYAWVNTLKSSLDEVQCVLKREGLSQVKSIGQLEGQTFCQDPHCGDVLVLPAQLKAQLYSTKLLSDHKLIIQDKFCSLGPSAVCSLLPEEGDVLMVGCFSGLTVFHMASLVAEKHKASGDDQPTVYICVSNCTAAQREELQHILAAMGCKNVKQIPEDFQSLDLGDKRLQRVRVILLTPKCSLSAVSNLVEFMLQESRDTDLLQDLSQGSIAQSKLEALVAQQRKDIDHALKFPKVLAVVYSTCSSYREENEEVVNRALERAQAHSEQEGAPKQANLRLGPSPFSILDHADDPYFLLEPSEESNGCFLAVLNREPEAVVKEAPQEVLSRANAKGILDGIGCKSQPNRKEHGGPANGKTKTKKGCSPQPHLTASVQSKHQETKSSSSTDQSSSQGKAKAQRLQTSKNTVSRFFPSKPLSSSSPYSSTLQNNRAEKNATPVMSPTSTSTSTCALSPAPPPVSPLVQVVRSRRSHQEVLKPVVLALPTLHFPNFFPPQHSQTDFNPSFSYKKGRGQAETAPLSRSTIFNEAPPKYRPFY